MKTINKLFLPLLLLSSMVSADDKVYSFIGIQASTSTLKNIPTPMYGVKYGRQSNNYRTSIAYNYGQDGSDYLQTAIMRIDTGILSQTFSDMPFKPYVGASFGVMQQNKDSLKPKRDRGYLYGGNLGFTYILNDAVDLDLAYRYLKTAKLENIDKIDDVTFAMHYFY